jgi:hypothetical protein
MAYGMKDPHRRSEESKSSLFDEKSTFPLK